MSKRKPDADDHPELAWPYGDRFMVYELSYKSWYLARVAGRDGDSIRVRYAGWTEEADEWIPIMSDRCSN